MLPRLKIPRWLSSVKILSLTVLIDFGMLMAFLQ